MATLKDSQKGKDWRRAGLIEGNFTKTGEARQPQVGEYFAGTGTSGSKNAYQKITDDCLPSESDTRWILQPKEVMAQDQENIMYRTEWYVSEESQESQFAASPDDELWEHDGTLQTERQAIRRGQAWGLDGVYKTTRVVRVDENGDAVEVMWMSVWDRQEAQQAPTPQAPGESLKILVWAPRDWPPPDHWGWLRMMENLGLGPNQWELIYGRKVDTRGKEVCWSIRFNAWHTGDPMMEWDWSEILGLHPSKIELVRTSEVPARVFPSSVETIKCVNCEKKVEKDRAWSSYHPHHDNVVEFCCCWCIEDAWEREDGDRERGEGMWRIDPDGIETEEPGCVYVREVMNAV